MAAALPLFSLEEITVPDANRINTALVAPCWACLVSSWSWSYQRSSVLLPRWNAGKQWKLMNNCRCDACWYASWCIANSAPMRSDAGRYRWRVLSDSRQFPLRSSYRRNATSWPQWSVCVHRWRHEWTIFRRERHGTVPGILHGTSALVCSSMRFHFPYLISSLLSLLHFSLFTHQFKLQMQCVQYSTYNGLGGGVQQGTVLCKEQEKPVRVK